MLKFKPNFFGTSARRLPGCNEELASRRSSRIRSYLWRFKNIGKREYNLHCPSISSWWRFLFFLVEVHKLRKSFYLWHFFWILTPFASDWFFPTTRWKFRLAPFQSVRESGPQTILGASNGVIADQSLRRIWIWQKKCAMIWLACGSERFDWFSD